MIRKLLKFLGFLKDSKTSEPEYRDRELIGIYDIKSVPYSSLSEEVLDEGLSIENNHCESSDYRPQEHSSMDKFVNPGSAIATGQYF